jgi:hypothetical protein
MRINIPKFAKGAAASSTLTIVGVCLIVVVATVPIIAVSFSAMALWKSPETVPSNSQSSSGYDSDGTFTGQGNLVKDCPAVKSLGATNLTNYNAWVKYINDGAQGTSAPSLLVLAVLWHENGDKFPNPTGVCTNETNCVHGWYKSPEPYNAYGPFQFQNGTWWDQGMTKEERQAAYDSGKVTIKPVQNGVPLSDSIFDPARAAKGAAAYLGASMDAETSSVLKDKIDAAIFTYNHSTTYQNIVYGYYEQFSACLDSGNGLADAPPASLSQTEKVLWWARHELKLNPSLNAKPPAGFHTANGENKVKYMNYDVNNSTSVVPGNWQDLGWCVAFATWVYEKAGYDIRLPSDYASPIGLEKWFSDETNNHTWISQASLATTNPKLLKNSILPGDIIIMYSGLPKSKSGMHAGIVESVDANGRIHTIEGNVGHDEIARRDYDINKWLGGDTSLKKIIGFARW